MKIVENMLTDLYLFVEWSVTFVVSSWKDYGLLNARFDMSRLNKIETFGYNLCKVMDLHRSIPVSKIFTFPISSKSLECSIQDIYSQFSILGLNFWANHCFIDSNNSSKHYLHKTNRVSHVWHTTLLVLDIVEMGCKHVIWGHELCSHVFPIEFYLLLLRIRSNSVCATLWVVQPPWCKWWLNSFKL